MTLRGFAKLGLLVLAIAGCSEFKSKVVAPKIVGPYINVPAQYAVGDMLLSLDHSKTIRTTSVGTQAAVDFNYYQADFWDEGVIPFEFDADFGDSSKKYFFDICKVWSQQTGVKCVERNREAFYVHVTTFETNQEGKPAGCYATVGRQSVNLLNLSVLCWAQSTILHELGHVIGLIHEHQRPDRDLSVIVQQENLEPNREDDFDILVTGRTAGAYDYLSIMHYVYNAYSIDTKDPTKATLVPTAGNEAFATTMGTSTDPTQLDIKLISRLYPKDPGSVIPLKDLPLARADFMAAMLEINEFYKSAEGLQRAKGLSYGSEPDFNGVAAWMFDIYLSTIGSGYTRNQAIENVKAHITMTDEWQRLHLGTPSRLTLTLNPAIYVDRQEYLDFMRDDLTEMYRTELLRSNGLSINGLPDFEAIAAWAFDVYFKARTLGGTREEAKALVLYEIRQSQEYLDKH